MDEIIRFHPFVFHMVIHASNILLDSLFLARAEVKYFI